MVAVRRKVLTIVVVAMILVLTGCSDDVAWNFRQSDAVGEWKSDQYPSMMKLEVRGDSTFTATDWPRGTCDLHPPTDWRKLDWDSRISFSGVLSLGSGDLSYVALLEPQADQCQKILSIDFWRSSTGSLSLRFLLDSADNVSKYSEIVLTKQQS